KSNFLNPRRLRNSEPASETRKPGINEFRKGSRYEFNLLLPFLVSSFPAFLINSLPLIRVHWRPWLAVLGFLYSWLPYISSFFFCPVSPWFRKVPSPRLCVSAVNTTLPAAPPSCPACSDPAKSADTAAAARTHSPLRQNRSDSSSSSCVP